MAEDVSFTNCYMAYISNNPYNYPTDSKDTIETNSSLNTGYHIIPNFLWQHYVTPKQFAEFQMKYEAYHVTGATCTIFNMIPMTTQLAIQGTNVFTAFNNTIYAIAYKDELYETAWENWLSQQIHTSYNHNLAWKEGLIFQYGSDTRKRYELPIYRWKVPHFRTATDSTWGFRPQKGSGIGVYPNENTPSGIFWDPLNKPDSIMELRPGKNSVSFSWECHACDSGKWFNLDSLASWWPWTATGPYAGKARAGTRQYTSEEDPDALSTQYQSEPPTNDYTLMNLALQPIVPTGWWWKEMQQSIVQEFNPLKPDLFFPGTEYELYKYPITQWFIKMIPLFDDNGTNIQCSANVSIKMSLHLKAKPRRSAIYAPSWGPFAWKPLYTAQTQNLNFYPANIRYRTGGARRTWQNILTSVNSSGQAVSSDGHWREDPYNVASTAIFSSGTGVAGTRAARTVDTTAPMGKEMIVTYNKDSDMVRLYPPQALKRSIIKDVDMTPLPVSSAAYTHITGGVTM